MNEIKISIKIERKNSIDITDSKSQVDTAHAVFKDLLSKIDVNEEIQVVQFPISSDMPGEIPFYILKSETGSFQLVYSRNYIQSTITTSIDKAGLCMQQQINSYIDSTIGRKEIKSIANTASRISLVDSVDDIKAFMSNTEYKNFNSINQLGFSFSYFKDSSHIRATGESVSYTSIANINESTRGIQTELTILLGGISFETGSAIDISEDQVKNYLDDMSIQKLDKLIGRTYGLAEPK